MSTNGLSASSRARQRRRQEGRSSAGTAVGDVSSQNASVVRRQLPTNSVTDAVDRIQGSGDARMVDGPAAEVVKIGGRKASGNIGRQLASDVVSGQRGDNIFVSVSDSFHSACILRFTALCRRVFRITVVLH